MTAVAVLGLRVLATAALFAFLGVALWTMWRGLQQPATMPFGAGSPAIQIELRRRGHRPDVQRFSEQDVVLGRDPMSDVVLDDSTVSARHARLSYHDGQWWVDDLGSRNGTQLNRQPLLVPAVLASGDQIKCGSVKIGVTLFQGTQSEQAGRFEG